MKEQHYRYTGHYCRTDTWKWMHGVCYSIHGLCVSQTSGRALYCSQHCYVYCMCSLHIMWASMCVCASIFVNNNTIHFLNWKSVSLKISWGTHEYIRDCIIDTLEDRHLSVIDVLFSKSCVCVLHSSVCTYFKMCMSFKIQYETNHYTWNWKSISFCVKGFIHEPIIYNPFS